MAQIEVKRDPNIEHDEIFIQLQQDSSNNMDGEYSPTPIQQTKVYGIFVPIVAINGIVVSFDDMITFELNDSLHVPTVKFEFYDRQNIFQKYINDIQDGLLQVQILPPEDDMYKKVDLNFYITKLDTQGGIIKGEGEYKLPSLTDTRWKALGQMTTYDFFDMVSVDTGLGFATNIEATNDKRYINCSYESYLHKLDSEIKKSDANGAQVLDWWIDLWNNLILCNIYDRVNSTDTEEDMMIWTTFNRLNVDVNEEAAYQQIPALYTNMPTLESTNLKIIDLTPLNNQNVATQHNTLAVTCYEENKKEYVSHNVLDGDVEKNIFTKYEYMGEVYGDYNYLLAEQCRDMYLNKIYAETLIIRSDSPQICLNRGSQLRVLWYDNDGGSQLEDDKLEGILTSKEDIINQMGWIKDFIPEKRDDGIQPLNINLIHSGQYTLLGQIIRFDGNSKKWDCYLRLTRPADKKPQILQTPK